MQPAKLTDKAMQTLKPALGLARGAIKREIKQGKSALYQTSMGNLLVVVRPEGQELVIVAVAGKDLQSSQQEILNFARLKGFRTLRFHTRFPKALQKGLAGLRPQLIDTRLRLFSVEYVYRLELY